MADQSNFSLQQSQNRGKAEEAEEGEEERRALSTDDQAFLSVDKHHFAVTHSHRSQHIARKATQAKDKNTSSKRGPVGNVANIQEQSAKELPQQENSLNGYHAHTTSLPPMNRQLNRAPVNVKMSTSLLQMGSNPVLYEVDHLNGLDEALDTLQDNEREMHLVGNGTLEAQNAMAQEVIGNGHAMVGAENAEKRRTAQKSGTKKKKNPTRTADTGRLAMVLEENEELRQKVQELESQVDVLQQHLLDATQSLLKHRSSMPRRSSIRSGRREGLLRRYSATSRDHSQSFLERSILNVASTTRQSQDRNQGQGGKFSKSEKQKTMSSNGERKQHVFSPRVPDYEEDPEVEKLLKAGPLTKDSLKSIDIAARKKKDVSQAGFRLLVESKEENTVAIEKVPDGFFVLPSITKMQLKLKWVKEPRRVLIVKRPNDKRATRRVHEIINFLSKRKVQVILEEAVKDEIHPDKNDKKPLFFPSAKIKEQVIDFIICLGGDGTILWACGLFPEGIPPVVSFKLGSLGFLTPFPIEYFADTLKRVLMKDLEATIRARLLVTVNKAGKPPQQFTCLNECVAKHPSKMVSLDLYTGSGAEDEWDRVTVVHADGLIVATPTGSTAYSLACGGSMLHPAIPAIVVTPIAPHTLSFRPIVLPDSSTLRIAVPKEARSEVYLSFDGRDQILLDKGDEVRICVSEYPVAAYSIDGESSDWFSAIKSSFLWNVRTEQKELYMQ